jgi:CRISPR-associated protein (TIGR03984 family)
VPDKKLENDEQLLAWVAEQMKNGGKWLLAHCDDGVVWGKRGANNDLVTSHQFAPTLSPPLRLITLQQAFVFGPRGEARLWRGEMNWEERAMQGDPTGDHIDEDHILWGTEQVRLFEREGFTHVRERRQQGMEHVVPIKVSPQELAQRRLKLRVRHFIHRDPETGEARIFFSRLVDVFITPTQRSEEQP